MSTVEPTTWPFATGEMAARVRAFDWATTPLGPTGDWSPALRTAVALMLGAPQLASLVVGPERVFLYNDMAAAQYGDQHPGALGRPLAEAFPEGSAAVAGFYDRAFAGESLRVSAQPLDTSGVGAPEVYDAYLTPVRDADGAVLAVMMTGVAIGDRLRAASALRHREERQAFLLGFSDALRTETEVDGVANRAIELLAERLQLDRCYITFYRPADDAADFPYQTGNDSVPPLPATVRLSDFPEAYEQVRHKTFIVEDDFERTGLSEAEQAHSRALGMRAMVASTARKGKCNPLSSMAAVSSTPRRWTASEIALVEEVAERTWAALERARAEAALRASEARLAAFFTSLPVGAGLIDLDGRIILANAEMRRFLPASIMPSNDPAWLWRWRATDAEGRAIDPADFPGAKARRGIATLPGLEMVYTGDSGREVWTSVSATPILGPDGAVVGHAAVVHDIDALKRGQETQKLLIEELQHRVRNILAIIRSIARRSYDPERSAEDYAQHLDGRLAALARTQVVLTRRVGAGMELEDVIRDELLVQAAREDRFTLDGPPVTIAPKALEVLTLAIHELATNATNYGAFARDGGRVTVRWREDAREGERWLLFDWIETGVPVIDAAPRRQGFGSELIEQRVPYELGGTGSLVLRPGGVHCRLHFPLAGGDSILRMMEGA